MARMLANVPPSGEGLNILLVLTRYLGDTLLMTGVIRSLRHAYPTAHICALVANKGKFALQGNTDLDELLVISDKFSMKELLTLLPKHFRRYDWVINDKPSGKCETFAFLFGKLGRKKHWQARVIDQKRAGTWRSKPPFCHHSVMDDDDTEHRIVRGSRLLQSLGNQQQIGVWAPTEELPFTLSKPYWVLHIPASNDLKQWPIESWAQLIRWLVEHQFAVALTGSPAQRDKQLVSSVMQLLGKADNIEDLSGQLSIAQMATLIEKSAGYIGPDGGTTHLASAFNVPIIAIFNKHNAAMWAPWPYQLSVEAYMSTPFNNELSSQTLRNVTVLQPDKASHLVPIDAVITCIKEQTTS